MVLKWVKENIEKFGGDPGKVTIFGEDSGAASVTLMAMSPPAQGLFHGAIALSGNPGKLLLPNSVLGCQFMYICENIELILVLVLF